MDDRTNRQRAVPRVHDEGWLVGKLVAHGAAPFRGDPDAPKSYYIRLQMLETDQGAQRARAQALQAERPVDGRTPMLSRSLHDGGVIERWGKDLERAIRDSKSRVEIGQVVAAKVVTREPILGDNTSKTRDPDKPAYWNRWEVETVQYVAQRNRFAHAVNENRRNARRDGVNGAEALALYLIHEGAERLAAARYPNAADRKAFVDRVRNFFEVSPDREAVIARTVQRLAAQKSIGPSDSSRAADREPPTRE
jgi:hypothetical protein